MPQFWVWKSHFTVNLKMGSSLPGWGGILKNEIQGFPESRSIVKKLMLVKKASVSADEQMVNWERKLKYCQMFAPGMAEWLFDPQPGEQSWKYFPRLHTEEARDHCRSPSSQMWFWVGKQGRNIWPIHACFLFCWSIRSISAKHSSYEHSNFKWTSKTWVH